MSTRDRNASRRKWPKYRIKSKILQAPKLQLDGTSTNKAWSADSNFITRLERKTLLTQFFKMWTNWSACCDSPVPCPLPPPPPSVSRATRRQTANIPAWALPTWPMRWVTRWLPPTTDESFTFSFLQSAAISVHVRSRNPACFLYKSSPRTDF